MKYIRAIDWPEIEERWKEGEEEIWREFYEKKGFSNWKDWRWSRIKLLSLEKRQWTLEEPNNVILEVRKMLCDATTRWTDFYEEREKSTFEHLKDHSFFVDHLRVKAIRNNFPDDSLMIALRNRGRSIITEGHHRGVGIAGMNESYAEPKVQFAISDISDKEFERLYRGGIKLKIQRRIWDTLSLVKRGI